MSRHKIYQSHPGSLTSWVVVCQVGLALLTTGCLQAPELRTSREAASVDAKAVRPDPAVVRNRRSETVQDGGDLGLQILRPSTPATDEVVARVGDQVVRKSHIYDRLRQTSSQDAELIVNQMVLDLVVAAQASRLGIHVDPERIDSLVQGELEALRSEVDKTFHGRRTLEEYLVKAEGLTLAEYRKALRLKLARERYRSYVIRYLAMLEDQIEVRFIATKDRDALVEVAKKVKSGADFATLARRYSEDEDTRENGGRLAPFSRNNSHPIVPEAFKLQPGDLSEIFSHEDNGVRRYFLVYCLRRMPKRNQTFAELREEIDRNLEKRPIERLEHSAFFIRWCQPTESLPSNREAR